jgi:hypothetical protein
VRTEGVGGGCENCDGAGPSRVTGREDAEVDGGTIGLVGRLDHRGVGNDMEPSYRADGHGRAIRVLFRPCFFVSLVLSSAANASEAD